MAFVPRLKALQRDLKLTEYEAAHILYAEAQAADIPLDLIIGIVYRQGVIDGRKRQRESDAERRESMRRNFDKNSAQHAAKHAQDTTQPTSGVQEGAADNE